MEEDESRFAILEGPIDDFIDERENKKHKSKDRDAIYKLNEFDLAVFLSHLNGFPALKCVGQYEKILVCTK